MIGVSARGWLLHSGCWNVVRVERPQASQGSSHDAPCRTGRVAGRDRDLHRDPPGQRGHEDDARQDRPRRRPPWPGSCAPAGAGRSTPALRATSRRRAPASIPRRPGSADPGGDRPERCRRSREVGADPGLTPARPTGIQARVSRCRDGPARAALCEAAHSLLVRGRTWSALRAWGVTVAKARGPVGSAGIPPGDRPSGGSARGRWPAPASRPPASSPSCCIGCGATRPGSASAGRLTRTPVPSQPERPAGPGATSPAARADRIVPVQAKARKVARQAETPRSPDPSMRRPRADREEKRGPAATTHPATMAEPAQLGRNHPNRRGLSDHPICSRKGAQRHPHRLQRGKPAGADRIEPASRFL